jgi:hypothetical protein
MVRWLNVVAVLALIGSAIYAYRVKYETIFFAERITNLRNQNAAERDAIAVLRAEWAHLTRPIRIQALADQHLELKQLTVDQIVRVGELPDQPPRSDTIGRKLDALGLGEPTSTPRDPRVGRAGATTPTASRAAIPAATAAANRSAAPTAIPAVIPRQ